MSTGSVHGAGVVFPRPPSFQTRFKLKLSREHCVAGRVPFPSAVQL